ASMCRWEYPHSNLTSLILADDKVFAGGEGIAVGLEAQSGNELWKTEVQGKVQGLAVTERNLFISTDNGNIYCFNKGRKSRTKKISSPIDPSPYRRNKLGPIYESTAERIIRESGIQKGYCLVLGSGTGRLAYELAKRSELKIIGIEKDQKKVAAAKQALDSAGIYGSRIVVESWDLPDLPDYFADLIVSEEMMLSGEIKYSPKEMFRVLKPYGGVAYFGQALGASDKINPLEQERLLAWLSQSGAPEPEVTNENGIWAKVTRGILEGSGSWTEQYGNPQNTACSMDQLVKGPLGVLWFGDPGPEKMVERHAKAASPVSINGCLFIQGEEVIMAYDAFNGTLLWEKEIPGAVRPRADVDGGNLVATDDCLYVAAHDKCYCLDTVTGETIRVIEAPPYSAGTSCRWAYVSFANGILYGSRAEPLKYEYFALRELLVENGKWKDIEDIPSEYREEYEDLVKRYPVPDEKLWEDFKRSGALWRFMVDFPDWEIYESSKDALTENIMTSDIIFAVDSATGKLRWKHQGNQIAHITISIGDGKIFFAENKVSGSQKRQALTHKQQLIRKGVYEEARVLKEEEELPYELVQELIKEGIYEEFEDELVSYEDADVRAVFCLDAATGKKIWEKSLDLTGCGGDMMGTAYKDGVLLVFGNMGDHDAWRFQNGSLRWKRLTALSARTGKVLWSRPVNYRTRPVIVGNQVFIEPRVCDLHTGKIMTRKHPVTGKQVPWEYLRPGHTCAVTSASAHALFYRSSSTAIYDFSEDNGLILFGGIRPGCWINMIPANGLLLFPEASAGCTCSFPLRCSVVLKHKENRAQPWTVFITHGAMSPVKHFAINLGAPADMKDDQDNVWFGYPNPDTEYLQNHFPNYGVKFDLHDEVLQGMGYFCSDFKNKTVEGSDKPWLFTSGCVGLTRCEVPLIDDIWGDKPGVYTVRLGFSALMNDRVGQRVFDVSLQDEPVLKNFDIVKESGNPNKAVIKEFKGIHVENVLTIELSLKKENPTIGEAPLINFIEINREDVDKDLETVKPVRSITKNRAESLLQEADIELSRKRYGKALDKYHAVFDASPIISFKQWALEGMAVIGSPKSLTRIARYCRDTEPILWNYNEPNPVLKNSATRVFIAVANNTAKIDKQKAVKMLNYALSIANFENRKQVLASLERLGIEIYGEPGQQD
ncbi:MAG: methyltransferase domain-containing protein, partial [Candidatus Aminicenantes bacterium]